MTDASEPIDLTGYQIVIPGNSTNNNSVESLSAYELKDALTGLGYTLNVVADNGSSSVNAKSILIGKTAATAGDMPTGNQFSITEDNGTVQISASNYYGYRAALAYLKSEIDQSKGLPQALDYSGDANVAHAERPTESSIRVMFSNVFGWNNWPRYDAAGNQLTTDSKLIPPENLRQDLQQDLFATYLPDIVGFQEYTVKSGLTSLTTISDYHQNFTPRMTSLGYAKVEAGTDSCTPLFYNPSKLEVLACGFKLYANSQDPFYLQSKGVTWAVFRVKTGADAGKMFAVCNTHFSHDGNDEGDEFRALNATELLGVIKNEILIGDYANIPVIAGGDLNYWNIWGNYKDYEGTPEKAELTQKAHNTLLAGGMKLASGLAGGATNYWTSTKPSGYTNSYHGYYEYNTNGSYIYDMENSSLTRQNKGKYTLDYIYLYNESNATVQQYYILEDDLTLRASDHCPTLIDVVLK